MKSIPAVEGPGRYEEREFADSKFVEITSDENFDVRMQYPALHMKNAEEHCYVREEVYEMLVRAARLLPEGYRFRIWDAWRPFALQHELYTSYSVDIIKDFELEDCTEEQKKAVICKFVSDPVEDREIPPVHTTGGAVDLTIVDAHGNELDMGTEFDAFTDKTCTAFFENEKNETVKENRRLLYHVMTSVGFTNLPSEWWHFDYGDRFWAFYEKKPAMYRGVFTREEIHGTG
ncbi:MAG: M15 family metallopeptidase [Eubacteriales bacterium]|nr:M15 family metallopeptidase [Eubacteriales bacterium]